MYKLVPWWLRDGQECALSQLAMSRIETQPPLEQRVYYYEPALKSCVKRVALISHARMDLQSSTFHPRQAGNSGDTLNLFII